MLVWKLSLPSQATVHRHRIFFPTPADRQGMSTQSDADPDELRIAIARGLPLFAVREELVYGSFRTGEANAICGHGLGY